MNPLSGPPLFKRSATAALLLVSAACSTPKPTAEPPLAFELPAAWAASASAAPRNESLLRWWTRLDDPQLTRLVQQAMEANTGVKGAQAALRQARALRDVAGAALGPTAGVSASAQRSFGGGAAAGNSFRAGFDASWEPDLFGARRSALDAAQAGARASAASLGDVQVSITGEVAIGYIALRAAQLRLAIANENLMAQQDTLQISLWRLQAGLVTSLDTEQARAATEQTRALLPALQTTIEQNRHALAVLTGQPPAALAGELAASAPVPQAGRDLALGIPAETLLQRPDVRAAREQVAAAAARVAQADAARWPSVNLGASTGVSAITLGALTNGAAVASALLASIAMPVFDGGALRAQVRAQQAALEQAQWAFQASVLTALTEVEDALVALRGDRERLQRLQLAAQAAANAAQLARQRYGSGLVDFQTVLETQRTLLGTQDGVAVASAEAASEQVRLYKALGGGWIEDTGEER